MSSHPRPLLALTAAAVATVATLGVTGFVSPPTAAAIELRAATPTADLPTTEQLRTALLSAAELGPDFTEVPATEAASPGATPSPVSGCEALSALLNRADNEASPQQPHAEVEFDGEDANPMITESLTAGDEAQLTTDFAAATDAFNTCHTLTFNNGTDAEVSFTVTPLALGDRPDAPAVRLDGTLAGVQLNGYLALERLGNVALAYGFFQRDSGSSQLASLYYRAALAKAERTLGSTAGSTTAPTAPAGMTVTFPSAAATGPFY
ncbi:hypothetical protein ACFVVX_31590 [Kitasatospora sp. NPDC058170]|uniref:hypothetical protein n=1 Tax=Kitasatospora sp. NPDC058170 TaxID=3346364 RepID=UPI0036DF22E3